MKKLYYRSEKISNRSFVLMAVTAIAAVALVQRFPSAPSAAQHDSMIDAAQRADRAIHAVAAQRRELGLRTREIHDPGSTGIIGPSMSLVTSLPGHLDAKQTSANPNFAAVAVHYLLQSGAKPGDQVAIGCTGSFPALNIAVISAAESIGLKPVLITSAASSQFGANHPKQMWPVMERYLVENGILETRSLGVSRGGFLDRGAGMTTDSQQLLDEAIAKGGRPILSPETLEESIELRMAMFSEAAEGISSYAAYINVGGGAASVGGTQGNDQLGRGLLRPSSYRPAQEPIDSVAHRFLLEGIPVINMIEVVAMAKQHGLPVASNTRPEVGEAGVYVHSQRRPSLAIAGILLILVSTSLLVRPPYWLARMLDDRSRLDESSRERARWMV